MLLSDEERRDYEAKIAAIVQIIVADGDDARNMFTTPEILARESLAEEPCNIKLITAVKGAHLAFDARELKAAMKRYHKLAAAGERRMAALNIDPANEREYVNAFMAARQFHMDYHRHFYQGTKKTPMRVEDIANDARLSAGDLDLIKPRGDRLSVTEIGVALAEWTNLKRQQRKEIVAQEVAQLPTGRDRLAVLAEFQQVCDWYFAEPRFAAAACVKFIWAIKRRLLGLPIKHVHMLCIVGQQDTGKTEMAKILYSPLDELAIEVSLPDLLDTRQMDMPEYYVAFCDELAFAENARPAQLKTFLNGSAPSRRPMRTNLSEKIAVNVTVIATANHSLDKLIYDSTGMRRFVEIKPRLRAEIEPYWHRIVPVSKDNPDGFDWRALWQAIDPLDAVDPLVSQFRTELMAKQEQIRNLDNTEMWLRNCDFEEYRGYHRVETSTKHKMEFYSEVLYTRFRFWEAEYDPGFKGTSLQRWGREMHSLIDNGKVQGWGYRLAANKTVYSKELPIQAENQVVPISPRRTA